MHENRLIKNTIILAFGQLVPKVLSLVILPILTNGFSTSEYGEYDLAITLSSMILPIITLQIYQAVFRELLAEKDIQKKSVIISTALIFMIFTSLIVSAILGGSLICMGVELWVAFAIILSIVGEAYYTISGQIVRGIGNNLGFSVGAIIYSIVNALCVIVILIFQQITVFNVILGIFIAYSLATTYLLYKSRSVIFNNFKFDKMVLKKLLAFSLPIIPSTISLWVVNMSDRLLVTYFMGIAANGIYSVATKIPNLYNTAYGIFNMAWIESASVAQDSGESEKYYSVLFEKLFSFLTGIVLLILSLLPVLFMILIDDKFYDAYNQSVILFLAVYINSFVSFYGGIYLALRKTGNVAISSIMGAIINIVINILFISRIGLYAASLSTAISFAVIAVFRAIDIGKYVKISYNFKEIVIGFVLVIVFIIGAFQKNIVINLFVFVLSCIYNRRNLYLIKAVLNKIGGKIIK